MINVLNRSYRKHVAWLLFLLIYGELAGTLYAQNLRTRAIRVVPSPEYAVSSSPARKTSVAMPEPAAVVQASDTNSSLTPEKVAEEEVEFIGGPGQPEMSSFRSVSADNMVNLFTGDFSYSIPLLDVGGYPVNLFYNAGVSMDQEASWVGLGWNLNPGTVNRNMRGLPDDYNGVDEVTNVQSMGSDLTVGVSAQKNFEFAGNSAFPGSFTAGIFYNNRRGLGLEGGLSGEFTAHQSMTFKNKDEKTIDASIPTVGVEAGITLNSQYGMTLNGGFSVYEFNKKKYNQFGLSTSVGYNSRQGLTDLKIAGEYRTYAEKEKNSGADLVGSGNMNLSTNISFARASFTPTIRMPLTRVNQFYKLKVGKEKLAFFSNGELSGYLNETRIDNNDKTQTKPAYGYMYYEEANKNKDALLDFNRLNDGTFTSNKPMISIPVYTYDVFTINGEGTGGSFRGYRNNPGYIRDNETKSKSSSFTVSLDIGPGKFFHGGTILGGIFSPTMVEEWKANNMLRNTTAFRGTEGLHQGFYFKNPGEKAIIDEAYYNSVGGDQLIRPFLTSINTPSPRLASAYQVYNKDRQIERIASITSDVFRKERDKRTQVISYFTAEEAATIGLDKQIYSYKENVFPVGTCTDPLVKTPIDRYNRLDPSFYRKRHHISQVNVLEGDGRRYVYGIPVYQVKQKEVTFSTESTPTNQLITYSGDDNTVKNNKGRDHYFQSQEMGGYAHSFLLTAILSPDYVDVLGDGLTDDDLGTGIKFNYNRVDKRLGRFGNFWNTFKWRMPLGQNTANFNEGMKADARDDKGMYTYGEKELWYLHSIESKNMIATFSTSARKDGKQVLSENGGTASDLQAYSQKKLDRIDLYTKADLLKNPATAKPIKTVHFSYSYKLCANYPLNGEVGADGGKLTLDSIWFSFNGNQRQSRNRYAFKYAADKGAITANPSYNSNHSDRWGNYKPNTANDNNLNNADFPFAAQDQTKANAYASAWNLEKILLPGGGAMNVEYESDDYAFVQDKRAAQMTKIAGFSKGPSLTPTYDLYSYAGHPGDPKAADHRFVFFDVPETLTSKEQIEALYLKDLKQLLLKLSVEMPKGNIGIPKMHEQITVYGTIQNYDVVPGNDHRFYIELEETGRGSSPMVQTAMQILKDQLPHRAYPGYEVKGNGLVQVVRAVYGFLHAFYQGMAGFETTIKVAGGCKKVDPSYAFARLSNPNLKKLGGGHRVKRVVIADNWSKMTKRGDINATGLPDSYYGQEYDYTRTEEVNGATVTVSSGVASYEPGVGNEENPFREILKYQEKQFLGPTDHSNVELPVAETFFPSPSVGYSKVVVRSIHNKSNKRVRSGVGRQETEFFTTRDFPAFSDYTNFDPQSRKLYRPPFLNKILNFNKKDYVTLTQGFRVVLNDMNGKMKSQTSYPENEEKTPISSTKYVYRTVETGDNKMQLDNVLPVISGPDGLVTQKLIGKEVEVMNDFREHVSYTYSRQIPLNVDVFPIGPFPVVLPSIFKMAFRDESMYRSASTLKVVNQYGILDSIINNDKGSIVTTKNLVYDAETGEVLVSRTNNEFKKPVYKFSYPAWWVNSGMEQAYRNIDMVYRGVLFRNGKIENLSPQQMSTFESGDELYAIIDNWDPITETTGCVIEGYPLTIDPSKANLIWAVALNKDDRNAGSNEFIFLDRTGQPFNAKSATIRLIRSGKRNMIGASVGNIVSMENPVREITEGVHRLMFDDNTNVLNAGAMEFREKWRAQQMFYTKDSLMTITRKAPLHNAVVALSNWRIINQFDANNGKPQVRHEIRPAYLLARHRSFGASKNNTHARDRSYMLFDISSIPAGQTIYSAKMSLSAHSPKPGASISLNHPFFGENNHNGASPHYRDLQVPVGLYNFRLSRTLSGWPVDNDNNAWMNMLSDEGGRGDGFERIVTGPASATQSYELVSTDSRIDITALFKGMYRDKNDPLKNYAPGIVMRMLYDTNWNRIMERRVCFFSGGNSGEYNVAPYIGVQYYNCSEAYGLPGNPATPPPGQQTVDCISQEIVTLCLSVFNKKQMNPYVEGVLGNWRSLRSYVYYGERRESEPLTSTDISKMGVIKLFEPYWTLAANNNEKIEQSGSNKWTWNSEVTLYNRKGAELENRDPLGRYNAGIYGYLETLPLAVVNNSQLRQSAYEGFEDYDYKDNPCPPYCNPYPRHFNSGIDATMRVSTQAHTGKYSAKIPALTSYMMPLRVTAANTETKPDIRIKIQKNEYQRTTVRPKGIGLTASYYNNSTFTAPVAKTVVPETRFSHDVYSKRIPLLNVWICEDNRGTLPPEINCANVSVEWDGYVQVPTTGIYKFDASVYDDEAKVWIDSDGNGSTETQLLWAKLNQVHTVTGITLTAGTLYRIKFQYRQETSQGHINFVWKTPDENGNFNDNQTPRPLNPINFYPVGQQSLADGTVATETFICEKPDTIQTITNPMIQSFSMIPGTKVVASLWVKMGENDCQCSSYAGQLLLNVNNSAGEFIAGLTPKERVIEGWQQFEGVFTVPPSGAVQLEFNANAPGKALYFDDLRIHPFNGNMKSFVYDEVTLRLSAELDENNFATFYEYDDEGTPVRVKKETKNGIKTIKETRSSLQKNNIEL
jgi:hypothetical protein